MKFAQASLINLGASVTFSAMNMVISIIESRILGPEGIGQFNVLLSTQTIFVTVLSLGIGRASIYFINSEKINEYHLLSTAIKCITPLALVCSIMLFGVISFFSEYYGILNSFSLFIFILGTFSLLLISLFRPILLAKFEIVKNQIVIFSARTVFLANLLMVIVYSTQMLDVGMLLAFSGFSNVISLLILLYYFKGRFSFKDQIDYRLLKRVISFGLRFSSSNIAAILLGNLPIIMLSIVGFSETDDGYSNVGYYTRAATLLVIGTMINTSIGPLLYSKWSGLSDEIVRVHAIKSISMFNLINISLTIFLFVFAPILIVSLYGKEFVPAILLLRIMSFMLLFNSVREVGYNILTSRNKSMYITQNLLISIIIFVVISFPLTKLFGIAGCAISVLISTIISTLLIMRKCAQIIDTSVSSLIFRLPCLYTILDYLKQIIK